MNWPREMDIRIACSTRDLPAIAADFLIREGIAPGRVIMAAARFQTARLRGKPASVVSFVTDAAGADAARRFLAGDPAEAPSAPAAAATFRAVDQHVAVAADQKNINAKWAKVIDEFNAAVREGRAP
jgi:hypothetical protein